MALIGGALTWAAFPTVNWWPAAVVGIAFLIHALRGAGLWRGAGIGFLYGLAFFAPLVSFTTVSLGNPSGWIALSITEALYFAALGAAWAVTSRLAYVEKSLTARVVGFAIMWAGTEELRSSWPFGGFPWGRLSFAMADSPILPLASIAGSLGLGLVVVIFSGLLVEGIRALRGFRVLHLSACIAAAAVFFILALVLPVPTQAEDGTLRVGAVQGNVAEDFNDAFGKALEVTTNHVDETQALIKRVGPGGLDVVIWPENAADLDPRTHPDVATLIDSTATDLGAQIVVGAVLYRDKVRYNDMVVWTPGQGAGAYYRKHRPVPFGEYIPMRSLIRRVTTQVDRVSTDMVAGRGPTTLTIHAARQDRDITLAMGICFEVAYDDVLREGTRDGGKLIVIPTNNASFVHSTEAAQQLAMGRVQAVIHGRAVVQVSTVGITAIITPNGLIEQSTKAYTADALVADVPLRTSLTVADRVGVWPGYLAMALAALMASAGIVVHMRRTVRARLGRM